MRSFSKTRMTNTPSCGTHRQNITTIHPHKSKDRSNTSISLDRISTFGIIVGVA